MMATPVTNDPRADERYLRSVLARFADDPHAARSYVLWLGEQNPTSQDWFIVEFSGQGQSGEPWFKYIAAILTFRIACEARECR